MEQRSKPKFDARQMALIGVLSALVFALSWVQIQIPLAGDNTRIHLGNIMCLLSGVVFGPLVGGLSAGFGSMIFDFTNPLYISEFWITFLTKFAMGFVAGLLAHRAFKNLHDLPRMLLGAAGGQLTYIVLYGAKSIIMQHWVYGNPWEAALGVAAVKVGVSALNGAIAVVGCTLLAPALKAALRSAGLFKQGHTA
ncbi:ECF transporter S component [Ruminococcaceae bacterium OttesenSCG-928-D13]|nr:ECF transporter S component [Ruminococcaceae bacterium OttesenSCG-928-D13]